MNEVSEIFASNLHYLIGQKHHGNVSAACREMEINRTQLNRYLSGSAHPTQQPLMLIVEHFKTDARILHIPIVAVQHEVPHFHFEQVQQSIQPA